MKVITCPNCGSTSIHSYFDKHLGLQYKCETCDYKGPVVVETDIEKKFEKE